jgi:hypothetical protein
LLADRSSLAMEPVPGSYLAVILVEELEI